MSPQHTTLAARTISTAAVTGADADDDRHVDGNVVSNACSSTIMVCTMCAVNMI